jgi:transcriptional regulator with PAS, ATPase and Fis domain
MEFQELQAIKQRFDIVGNSPQLNYAIEIAARVAATDLSVLITGESGTGKESFSKIIHYLSHRKHNNFIAVNCGAIPEGTIDSELFGHEKGSFTGAVDARKGYFEVTDGGSIFLDEIGEMPLGTQARLLRILENGEYIRVGSSKVLKTNVRIIAATNVNLVDAVSKGKFREDLYYRLNTVPIYVPPLRERGTDIEWLFRKFAQDFSEKQHIKMIKLSDDAKELLLKYHFPGNVRQLKNIVEQISILEITRDINAAILQKYLPKDHKHGLPILRKENEQNESNAFSDRDLLIKVLFDMRRDMQDMKQLLLQLTRNRTVAKEEEDYFATDRFTPRTLMLEDGVSINKMPKYAAPSETIREVTIDKEIEQDGLESLSLEEKEKEMIIKALEKNHHKRKYAAHDLGISERTLYRKIKQYGIEEK